MNTRELFDLGGRVALVTGGAGKYGRCIAEALAEAGARVVIASRREGACAEEAGLMRARGLDVSAGELDQASEESVRRLRDRLVRDFGRLDILVNNAVARPGGGTLTPGDIWRESMAVNAVGLFLCTSVFLEQMQAQARGNIINIASMYGLVGQFPPLYEGTELGVSRTGDYAFHRGGIINYTRYLAAVHAPAIRVNCISPGGLNPDNDNHSDRFLKNYARQVPMGRMANRDDIKGAVVYLASDASAYVTGHNLVVDGGWTIW